MKRRITRFDKRLLGVWKSDGRKTLNEFRKIRGIKKSRLKKLEKIFGKLVLRYTRTRIYSAYAGYKHSYEYKVLGIDQDSIAIQTIDEYGGWGSIYHIHFERNWYWISLGPAREFFRKMR